VGEGHSPMAPSGTLTRYGIAVIVTSSKEMD
jgi:hypothetical protein